VDRARRAHHRVLAVALATLLVPLVVGSAAAAPGNRPSVTVTPTVINQSVSVEVDVNRATNQIASCAYVLDSNAAMPCGAKTANGSKASRYAIALGTLSVGPHTITVTVRATDGGSGAGSTSFRSHAKRFAIAFTNRDGIDGYDPAKDVLISELVDGNADGIIDVGDTINLGSYPLDLGAAGFGKFQATPLTVTSICDSCGTLGPVVETAEGFFTWRHVGQPFPQDIFIFSSGAGESFVYDWTADSPSGTDCDQILVFAGGAGQPDTAAFDKDCSLESRTTDADFIDVEVTP
jgi:hypothetical protein